MLEDSQRRMSEPDVASLVGALGKLQCRHTGRLFRRLLLGSFQLEVALPNLVANSKLKPQIPPGVLHLRSAPSIILVGRKHAFFLGGRGVKQGCKKLGL